MTTSPINDPDEVEILYAVEKRCTINEEGDTLNDGSAENHSIVFGELGLPEEGSEGDGGITINLDLQGEAKSNQVSNSSNTSSTTNSTTLGGSLNEDNRSYSIDSKSNVQSSQEGFNSKVETVSSSNFYSTINDEKIVSSSHQSNTIGGSTQIGADRHSSSNTSSNSSESTINDRLESRSDISRESDRTYHRESDRTIEVDRTSSHFDSSSNTDRSRESSVSDRSSDSRYDKGADLSRSTSIQRSDNRISVTRENFTYPEKISANPTGPTHVIIQEGATVDSNRGKEVDREESITVTKVNEVTRTNDRDDRDEPEEGKSRFQPPSKSDISEMNQRLARLEYLLSNPLDVKLVE